MNGCKLNPFCESALLKRRSSVFKPTLEDDEAFKSHLAAFIELHQGQDFSFSNSPITWERLSTGYRIVDFQIDRTEEALDLLKVVKTDIIMHFFYFF